MGVLTAAWACSLLQIMGTLRRLGKARGESPPLTVEMQQVESPDARRRLRQAIELVLGIVVREREPTK